MARSTPKQWARRVEGWKASGLTATAYARKMGINERSLYWWTWRLKVRDTAAASVTPLTFVEMTSAVSREPFEVVLDARVRVRVPADFDSASLERLLDLLGRRQ